MRASGLALGVAVALLAPALVWGGSVRVEVAGMGIDVETGSPVVRLVEKDAKAARELPIWIGPFEATAIAIEMQGVPPPRPLTHDLMSRIVEQLGGRLERVEIEDLRDSTFFASLHLDGPDGRDIRVDARPSDAIALALRLHGPILVAEELFARAAVAGPGPASRRLWGLTVQELTPEVARFFRAAPGRGVLVSNVAAAAPAHDVSRGDVIIAVDGRAVRSVDDLVARADAHAGDDPVHLSLRRDGHALDVSFAER